VTQRKSGHSSGRGSFARAAAEKFQEHRFLGVSVGEGFDRFVNFYFDAQFLAQFAGKTLFEGFIRLAFAAGKFPKTTLMRLGVALGEKEFAVAKD
jgi:hypothetical protein